jgi:DNA-binding XRE family transcriptional regulator
MEKNQAVLNAKDFDEILDIQYGKPGTEMRGEFDKNAQYFVVGELLKEARRKATTTQKEIANKIKTKKVTFHALKMVSAIFNYPLFTKFLKPVWDEGLIY